MQLVVWHKGTHMPAFYGIPNSGWRIDCDSRMLVLGNGVPRKMIPLDNVLHFDIEEIRED